MISADRSAYGPQGMRRTADKRGAKPSFDPIMDVAHELANRIWEMAMEISRVIAPDNPTDQEPMSELDTWLLLESVAITVSPTSGAWDQWPQALNDLYALRKRYLGLDQPALKVQARYAEQQQRLLPDPSITPENPEFTKRMARLRRA